MNTRASALSLVALLPLLAACSSVASFLPGGARAPASDDATITAQSPEEETARPQARPASATGLLGSAGLRPEQLDRTSAEERAAALAPAVARIQLLGETLAALGNPAEPGLWLRTGLVSQTTTGRVEVAGSTESLRVELRPSGAAPGGGSQLSLAAFNTLNLPLTQLVGLRVYAE